MNVKQSVSTHHSEASPSRKKGMFFLPKPIPDLVQRQETPTDGASMARPRAPLHIFLLHGVSNTVEEDVQRTTQIFSAANLDFPYTTVPIDEQTTEAILGADGVLEKTREGASSYTQEEVDLIIPHLRRRMLNVFYVPRVSDRSTAGYTMDIMNEKVVIIDQSNNTSLAYKPLEHEIGHALGLDHIPTEPRPPEGHLQLMWPGLRLGNRLSRSEVRIVLSSSYVQRP